MNQLSMFQTRWRWTGLLTCIVLALAVLGSWLYPPIRVFWDLIDLQVFRTLNAPLASNAAWAHIWAVGNMRYADIGAALITFAVLTKSGWVFDAGRVRDAFYGFLALLLLLFLIRILPVRAILLANHWERVCPSLVIKGAVRLTEIFPGWEQRWYLKDSSNSCFPGDHAAVVMLWLFFIWPYATALNRLIACILTVILILPRLVSGAHWLTDDLVGGLALTLTAIGFGLYSPYAAHVVPLLHRLGDPVFRMLSKVPGLDRSHLISGR